MLGISFGGLIGLIVLAIRIAAAYHGSGWFWLTSRSTMEQFCESLIQEVDELTGILATVQDVPTARKAEARAVEVLRKIVSQFREMKDKKGRKTDLEAIKNKYNDRVTEATRRMGLQFDRIAAIPGVVEAMSGIRPPLLELQEIVMEAGGQDKTKAPFAFQPMQRPTFAPPAIPRPPAPPKFAMPPNSRPLVPPNVGNRQQADSQAGAGQLPPNRPPFGPGFRNGPPRPMPPRRIRPRFGPRAEPPGF